MSNQPNFLTAVMALQAVASLSQALRYYNHKIRQNVPEFLL
jgi:hypothetical protein